MNQHAKPGTGENRDSSMFLHMKTTGHSFTLDDDVEIIDKEERWFERGVREALYDRIEKPTLNRTGGLRFILSHIWDRTLRPVRDHMTPHSGVVVSNPPLQQSFA